MTAPDPSNFPTRILVTVAGLTPQIVTETLYALAVVRKPRFVPTKLIVLTTTEGAERARLTLLGDDPGWFGRLCRDYRLKGISFTAEDIVVLRDARGEPLQDIRTDADNAAVADGIAEVIRGLTADPASAVHVSVAGGRKTMGLFAAYALSLYGRPQDRVSHVLVSDAFEGNPAFFYPMRERTVIYDRDKRPLDASKAEVSHAEIKFVMLRNLMPEPMRTAAARQEEVVRAVQRRVDPPRVVIDLRSRRLTVDGVPVPMPPQELAFYACMARATPRALLVSKREPRVLDAINAEYRRLVASDPARETPARIEYDRLAQFKNKTEKCLDRALAGHPAAAWLPSLRVTASGEKLARYYGLGLPSDAVTIIEPSGV